MMFFRNDKNDNVSANQLTAGDLLKQCGNNLARAIEVVGSEELLLKVAENSFGVSALICRYGDNPQFARALLSNSDIMYAHCKNKAAIDKVLNAYEKAYIDVTVWPKSAR